MSSQRQSIHSIHNKKFWTEFFYLYESLPALWDMNNPLYKNRQVKCDAYDIMVDKLREIEPNSDREDVLRKINIFRTNYRRECSRITMSIQEGRQYQSTLWYFDLLCFLQTSDTRRERKRKLDDDGEKSIMRKRRSNNMVHGKSSNQYIMSPKKDHLIEYQTNSTQDYDYELEEEADYDFVADDIAHVLVDAKSDTTTSEMQQNSLQTHNDYQEDEDDENSQQEYAQDFQSYSLQRNKIAKTENPADNVGPSQLVNEIVPPDESIDINNDMEEQVFQEYADTNDETLTTAPQWCIKSYNRQGQQQATTTLKINEISTIHSTKFVRDVKTMTSSNFNTSTGCLSKLSESSEILAKSWAIQYNELTQDQKLLARKAINDILFDGCLGHLVIGTNGRVTTGNTDYTNIKTIKESVLDEVESGEVYEQTSTVSSSASSSAGVPTVVTSKVRPANDEWLKL